MFGLAELHLQIQLHYPYKCEITGLGDAFFYAMTAWCRYTYRLPYVEQEFAAVADENLCMALTCRNSFTFPTETNHIQAVYM